MPESAPAKKKKPPARITIREDRCKGCEFCVMFCPHDVLEMKGVLPFVKDAEACTRCMICESVCPDFAITVE